MKKLLWLIWMAVILTSMMLGGSLSASATVVEGDCGDIYNQDTGTYDNVTWSFNTETGVMTISGEGKMRNWSWGQAPWSSYRAQIRSVVIEEGVTHIGDHSFIYSAMTEMYIPASVTSVGHAFENCKDLTSVYITDLAAWCRIEFSSGLSNPLCHAKTLYLNGAPVTEIRVPDGVSSLNNYVFYNFEALTKITLPDSLLSIGESALSRCTSLTEIRIPDSVCSVAEDAFSGSTHIIETENGLSYVDRWMIRCDQTNTEAMLREDTVGIANAALNFASNLKKIYIPSSLRTIGNNEIFGADIGIYITSIAAWCGIDFFDAISNPLSANSSLYLNGERLTELVIPQGVTSIGKWAFHDYGDLVSVTIPGSVRSIGEGAFGYCENLTTVVLEAGVATIGDEAFKECSAVTSIDLPDGLLSIGEEAFFGCSSLARVSVPPSLASIGEGAFGFCSQLLSVHLTDVGAWCGVILHGEYANPTRNGGQFYVNGEPLTVLDIPDGMTSIGDYAFFAAPSLTAVTLPDSVTTIGTAAFSHCDKLKSIRLPNGLIAIEENAFDSCRSLESLSLPDSVTAIGSSAFQGCAMLTQINLPPRITTMAPSVFSYCVGLQSIRIPNGVTFIGDQAFYGCSRLEKVIIPPSVTVIGESAFSKCSALKTMVFCGTSQQWTSIKKGDYWRAYSENCTLSYHDWNSGAITQEHTSSTEGEKTFDCLACGETKKESLGHSYGAWISNDAVTHRKACDCGNVLQSTHSYSGAKDTTCNECDYVRTIESQTTTGDMPSEIVSTEASPTDNSAAQEPTEEESSPSSASESNSVRVIWLVIGISLVLVVCLFLVRALTKKK
ncbi:MAG: leucine-rich repeat domain-containing protein [Ruminococcaceae bacterium]|nr:leucine-rich repeat domain-containing protein [Oscillospiraceae bacterium]